MFAVATAFLIILLEGDILDVLWRGWAQYSLGMAHDWILDLTEEEFTVNIFHNDKHFKENYIP
jgi:hypothetical protein